MTKQEAILEGIKRYQTLSKAIGQKIPQGNDALLSYIEEHVVKPNMSVSSRLILWLFQWIFTFLKIDRRLSKIIAEGYLEELGRKKLNEMSPEQRWLLNNVIVYPDLLLKT
jgi:hypothetical protein